MASFIAHYIFTKRLRSDISKEKLKANVKAIQDFVESVGVSDLYPSAEVLIGKNESNFKDFIDGHIDLNSINSVSSDCYDRACHAVRLMAVIHFMLNKTYISMIESPSEDMTFDMFQSLNATGTPLTPLEVFKLLVVNTLGEGYATSETKKYFLDGYRRMLLDFVIKKYFPSFIFHRINDYLRISFHEVDSKTVCLIDVLKSDKQVFLKINGNDIFMVRIDASSRQVTGEDLVQYCFDRFK